MALRRSRLSERVRMLAQAPCLVGGRVTFAPIGTDGPGALSAGLRLRVKRRKALRTSGSREGSAGGSLVL
jgi:hypothetical protein